MAAALVALDDWHWASPVPGGPGILKWLPCEHGPSGHCTKGDHEKCAHRWGGPQHGGVLIPEGYVTDRRGMVGPSLPAILPMHRWRCPCECHTEAGATNLLELL
jgi:hypothetical protein